MLDKLDMDSYSSILQTTDPSTEIYCVSQLSRYFLCFLYLFIHHIMFENSPDALMIARSAVWWWLRICVLHIYESWRGFKRLILTKNNLTPHKHQALVLTPRRHISKPHHSRTRIQAEAGGCLLHNLANRPQCPECPIIIIFARFDSFSIGLWRFP